MPSFERFRSFALYAATTAAVLAPSIAAAQLQGQSDTTGLDATAGAAGLKTTTSTSPLEELVGGAIRALLSLVGLLFLVLMVYAGILWMTAQGDDTKVLKAKKLITQAVIGLIIVVSAYAFTEFILRAILNPQQGTVTSPDQAAGFPDSI